jgi:hypothetical protein
VFTEAFSQTVHDDLVIALALAVWGAENPLRRPTVRII